MQISKASTERRDENILDHSAGEAEAQECSDLPKTKSRVRYLARNALLLP